MYIGSIYIYILDIKKKIVECIKKRNNLETEQVLFWIVIQFSLLFLPPFDVNEYAKLKGMGFKLNAWF